MRSRWARGSCAFVAASVVAAAGCAPDDETLDVPVPLPTTTAAPAAIGVETTEATRDSIDLPDPADFELARRPATSEPVGPDVSILDRLPDLAGEQIRILGPEVGVDAKSFEAGLAPFVEATGVDLVYEGTNDDTFVLNGLIEDGDPPNLAVIAQPGRLLDLAGRGHVVPVPTSIVETVRSDFDPFWASLVTRRLRTYGVPNRASVKSLVWYSPSRFADEGYSVPTTWSELQGLAAAMRANGETPWCIGVSSGEATGWVFTDWVEDVMLRLHGPEIYDAWVAHEIGFDDERVLEAIDLVSELWFEPGNVLGGRSSIASTTFADAGLPLLDGACLMHKQASFYAGSYQDAGATIGNDGDVDAFYLPTIGDEFGRVVLGSGNYFAAFDDSQATNSLLAYVASAEYARARIAAGVGGYVSPNLLTDPASYPTEIERQVSALLLDADPFRFDGSDLMPAVIGTNEFWRASTAYITGAIDAQDLVDRVEASWPT